MQSKHVAHIARRLSSAGAVTVVLTLSACSGNSEDPDIVGDNTDAVEAIDIVIDDAYYAQLAQSYEAFVPDPSIGAAVGPEEYVTQGRWSEVVDWPEIATGAANLPDGRLMTWASTSKITFGGNNNFTYGSIYDPATGEFTAENNNYHNTFCAGISMLPDGRTIAAGGGATITKTSLFDLATNDWALTNEMNIPRWYSTTTTLPDGQAITALGTNANPYSEIWTEGTGWDVRTNLSLQNVVRPVSSSRSTLVKMKEWFHTGSGKTEILFGCITPQLCTMSEKC